MREFKFRAWDVEFGEMVGPDYNGDHWIFECDNEGLSLIRETGDEVCANYTTVKSVFMQYTGLFDKEGKEIYEGDLLKNERGRIGEVAWHRMGLWDTSFVSDDGSISNPSIDRSYGFEPRLWGQNVEVIGSIYENPELLQE